MPDTNETTATETMTTTTETTETTAAPVVVETATPAVANKSDNAILGCSKADKAEITELRETFVGKGSTKEYSATEKEFVGAMLHVVKNRRYEIKPRLNAEGDDWEYNEDGEIIYDEVDHLDLECRRQFALRAIAPVKKDYNDPAVLRAEMVRIQAKLAALGLK